MVNKARRRGAVAAVACCACALALGVALFHAGTAGSDAAQAIDPALFSSGACMAFPPTDGDRHATVFLDAGHGGIDPGGTGSTKAGATVTEARVNLAIELDATAILRAQGYR